MPQRFLDQQLPLEQTDTATRDVPPENYCNASMYICDNVYKGLPWEPANLTDQQDHRRKYRAAVSWTDWNAGRLLDELQTQGLENDTAVIFHGDHGKRELCLTSTTSVQNAPPLRYSAVMLAIFISNVTHFVLFCA